MRFSLKSSVPHACDLLLSQAWEPTNASQPLSYRTTVTFARLPRRAGREFPGHRKQQLAFPVIQIGRIAPDLGEESQFIIGDLLTVHMPAGAVFIEELRNRQ